MLLYTHLGKACHERAKFSSRDSYEELKDKLIAGFVTPDVPPEVSEGLFDAHDALDDFQSRDRLETETASQYLAVLAKLGDVALHSMAQAEKEKHIKACFLRGLNNPRLHGELARVVVNHEDLLGQGNNSITLEKLKVIVRKFETLLNRIGPSHSDSSSSSSLTVA